MMPDKSTRLDPVNATLWLVLFNLTVLQETRHQMQLLYLAEALFFAVFIQGVSPRRLLSLTGRILFLPSTLFIFHLFSHEGTKIVDLGIFQISEQGVAWGSLYFIRFANAIMAAIAFALSIKITDLMASLSRLGLPDRAALSVYLTLRFIPLITQEASTIWAATINRRANPQSFTGRLRLFGQYVSTLVLRTVDRAETTAIAVQYRQFGVRSRRTYLSAARWKPSNLAFLGLHAILVLFGFYLYH